MKKFLFAAAITTVSLQAFAQAMPPSIGQTMIGQKMQSGVVSPASIAASVNQQHAVAMGDKGQQTAVSNIVTPDGLLAKADASKKQEISSVTFSSEFEDARLIEKIRATEARERRWASQEEAIAESGLPIWLARDRMGR